MSVAKLFLKALCVSVCLYSLLASEDSAQDFIDLLRIPNPEKVLNSVLGRLERNRQHGLSARTRQQYEEDEDCEEPSEVLPEYTETLLGARERGLRQLGVQHFAIIPKKYGSRLQLGWRIRKMRSILWKKMTRSDKHYPICHLERKIRRLNTEEHEYRPAYYEEVRCTVASGDDVSVSNEICTSLGFSCVQWNKTIHLTRRRYSSDCWETKTMVIPAGCECMWPVHRLGDITLHV